jgi:hypothetical protein
VQLLVETQVLSCTELFSLMSSTAANLHCSSISGTVFQGVTLEDLEGTPVNLCYVKFQNIQNIHLFFNQNNADKTQIDHLASIGSPSLP